MRVRLHTLSSGLALVLLLGGSLLVEGLAASGSRMTGAAVPGRAVVPGFAMAASPVSRPAEGRAISLDDLAKLREVSDPEVSPDGKWIAYRVGAANVEKDRRDSELWMVSWDGSEHVRLTSVPESSESRPRWSPDGRYLAFLASRGDEEQKKKGSQVWLLDRRGGEAQQLSDIKGGVSDYDWSPDGRRLVLVVNDPDPRDEPEKLEGWKRKTAPPIVIDRYHFKEDREGYLQNLHTHLSLFDVQARKAETLTSGSFDDVSPAWSPDGASIAFVSSHDKDPDRTDNTDIYVIEAKPGAEARRLTDFPGPDIGPLAWSPDSKSIAYLQGDEPRYYAYERQKLAVVPASGGAPRLLTADLDRAVFGPVDWSRDSRTLTFVVSDDRITYVGRIAADGGKVERLTEGRNVVSELSLRTQGGFALLLATDRRPEEVYALENGNLRQLSHENDPWLGGLDLATTENFSCKAKDGTEVHGLMVKPPSYVSGRRYPTLLIIHGGPSGQDQYDFGFQWQLLAAHGYVVLGVNYRGSEGRGDAYQRAIYGDWGNKEVVDLLAAVDYAVESGVADPERLGLGGWSYGGILTDYTIATTTRFKAGVSGAGSAMQIAMYGVDQYVMQYDLELGPPWKSQDQWVKISYPFFHADRIKTPTLFLGGDKDFNVPLIGGEQMYQALRSLGVDTQLVIYPGQYHAIRTPSYLRDRYARTLAWFDKYLGAAGS